MDDQEKNEIIQKAKFDFKELQKFLEVNPSFAKNEHSKGIFSLGVLVQLVFALQQAKINSTPFESKLKGLHLTPKDVNRIYIEAVEKVNQHAYQSTYRELREYIAEQLQLHQEEINKMSNNEISFNFVCGLELGRKFKS